MVTNRSLLVRLRTTALEELRKTDAKCVDRLPKTRAERDSAAMLKPKSYVSHLAETKGPHIYWIDVEDRVGKVDVFQASHHGLDQSSLSRWKTRRVTTEAEAD